MNVKVVVIGAGLSGLHTAYELQKRNIDFILLEARDRLGGRIFSASIESFHEAGLDLGPSWFWPHQPYINNLLSELNLADAVFQQNGSGDALYEDPQGNIQRGIQGLSMQGANRIQGGMRRIITILSKQIAAEKILLSSPVTDILLSKENIQVRTNGSEQNISSDYVVLALPPRVAARLINFKPKFSEKRRSVFNNIATWMAGHEKLVFVYDEPFWLQDGLSGDAFSHRGPLQEIHDASASEGPPYALFGFSGVPPQHRKQQPEKFHQAAIQQLTRLFGEKASKPAHTFYKDWARDECTATQYDQEILKFHPANDIKDVTEKSWNDRLIWSGTESADPNRFNNGFLEGALESSHRTVTHIDSVFSSVE